MKNTHGKNMQNTVFKYERTLMAYRKFLGIYSMYQVILSWSLLLLTFLVSTNQAKIVIKSQKDTHLAKFRNKNMKSLFFVKLWV